MKFTILTLALLLQIAAQSQSDTSNYALNPVFTGAESGAPIKITFRDNYSEIYHDDATMTLWLHGRALGINTTVNGRHYEVLITIIQDTVLYDFESVSRGNETVILINVGGQSIYRTWKDGDFAYIFSKGYQSTCRHCIHFDGGNGRDLWFEPTGAIYYNGVQLHKSFSWYIDIMSFLNSAQ